MWDSPQKNGTHIKYVEVGRYISVSPRRPTSLLSDLGRENLAWTDHRSTCSCMQLSSHHQHGVPWLGGSVCDLQARDHKFDRRLGEFAVMLCSWAKPLPTHAPSWPRSKSGYLAGPRRLVCVITHVCQNYTSLVAVWLYEELGITSRAPRGWRSWNGLWMNRVLWPGGNCAKSGEQRLCWMPNYKPPPLSFMMGRLLKYADAQICRFTDLLIHRFTDPQIPWRLDAPRLPNVLQSPAIP